MDEDRIIAADREDAVANIVPSTGVRTAIFSNADLMIDELRPCGKQAVVFSGMRRSEDPISHIDTLDLGGGAAAADLLRQCRCVAGVHAG
jgi:hypothetical protein